MIPLNRYVLVSPANRAILAIDELREQLRSMQITTAESSAPAESTQSMDDHVLVSHLDFDLQASSLLAFMAPNSQMARLAVRVLARYAYPISNYAISTFNPRIYSRRLPSFERLIQLQLGESLMSNFPPMHANGPVAYLLIQSDNGTTELHSKILRNRSKVRS